MTHQKDHITDTRSTIINLLSGACTELFSGYEVILSSNEELINLDKAGINLISLIGLSDSAFRASLTICVTPNLLTTSFPAPEESINESDLHDWLGELANQLAGRFKNKLVPYGRKLELGIPTVIQGAHLKIDVPKCSNVSKHQFITEQGDLVELNLSTLIEKQFILSTPEVVESECLEEGEMLFF